MTWLDQLSREAAHCGACDLWQHATQTVFGEGSVHAQIMLISEQPGDKEDLAGHRGLEEAGIDRKKTYVTNAWTHHGNFA